MRRTVLACDAPACAVAGTAVHTYKRVLAALKRAVEDARLRAVRTVNTELLKLLDHRKDHPRPAGARRMGLEGHRPARRRPAA